MSKTLDRISKVLNQAENAGTPEEAATFMAKAQELASINNIDLAVARLHQASKERQTEPEERRIQINPSTRRNNRKHFLELAMVIADVNDVKYLIGGNELALHAVGFPTDLDVVEALFVHLSVQMATECDEALARGDHRAVVIRPKTEAVPIPEEARDWGGYDRVNDQYYDYEPREKGERYFNYDTNRYRVAHQPPTHDHVPVLDDDGNPVLEQVVVSQVNGRVFRGNFYAAFVERMRGRLWEIRKAVERDHGVTAEGTGETALALRDKAEDVNQAHEQQRAGVHHLGVYKGSDDDDRAHDHTGIARQAGRHSAERVPIDQGREVKRD